MSKDVPYCMEGEAFLDFCVWRDEEVEEGGQDDNGEGREERA